MDEVRKAEVTLTLGVAILAYFWTGQIKECTWEDDGCYTRKGALIC